MRVEEGGEDALYAGVYGDVGEGGFVGWDGGLGFWLGGCELLASSCLRFHRGRAPLVGHERCGN